MPVDRGAIDRQLRDIGESERWWELREFRDLPYILHPDERIRGLIAGKLLGSRRPRVLPTARWLVVATEQRLICLRQQRVGRTEIDIPLGQITGIRHGSRVRSYQIVLETPPRKYRLRVPKEDAFRFLGVLAPLVQRAAPPSANAGAAGPSSIPGWGPLGVLPGVSELVSKALAPPPPPYASRADLARVERAVERMEQTLERLQEQVDFLEELLEKRAEDARPAAGSAAEG